MTPLDLPRRDVLKAAALAPALAIGTPFSVTAFPAAPAVPAQRPVDLVLRSGNIITADGEFTLAAAIAIARERILTVGGDADHPMLRVGREETGLPDIFAVLTMVGGRVVHASADWPG